MKLNWEKCPCGDDVCKRMHPTNIGTFYMGSGFEPKEAALLDRLFELLTDEDPEFIEAWRKIK